MEDDTVWENGIAGTKSEVISDNGNDDSFSKHGIHVSDINKPSTNFFSKASREFSLELMPIIFQKHFENSGWWLRIDGGLDSSKYGITINFI
ncbi:hypothetical protein TNCV_4331471 [Trichonephila clavipes]|nr:hypothetical protein TNCV_4331471 [Trichonephila clavipes]